MKKMINMTVFSHDMDRFESQDALKDFYRSRGLDGLELQVLWNERLPEKIPREDVVGVHLRMFPYWLDFWQNDQKALLNEFDKPENWEVYYEGKDPSCILNRLEKELDMAQALNAEYVVFHVSDCRFTETYHNAFHYSDEAVIDASCEIINTLLDGKNYTFKFLVENLWWPGLTLTRPEMTERLLKGIHTGQKGIDHPFLKRQRPDNAQHFVMAERSLQNTCGLLLCFLLAQQALQLDLFLHFLFRLLQCRYCFLIGMSINRPIDGFSVNPFIGHNIAPLVTIVFPLVDVSSLFFHNFLLNK